jgi:hypothetical protein
MMIPIAKICVTRRGRDYHECPECRCYEGCYPSRRGFHQLSFLLVIEEEAKESFSPVNKQDLPWEVAFLHYDHSSRWAAARL